MSGERRRAGGWLLPVIVVAVGALFLLNGVQNGTLKPVSLKPVNLAGLAVMAAGIIAVIAGRRTPLMKLAGVFICGAGAIMVICL
ncbi:MAG: hypothetical protein IJJ45_03375 [Clostridia bacterium]|nr:hypothetical protein [Clostridia bacterium]